MKTLINKMLLTFLTLSMTSSAFGRGPTETLYSALKSISSMVKIGVTAVIPVVVGETVGNLAYKRYLAYVNNKAAKPQITQQQQITAGRISLVTSITGAIITLGVSIRSVLTSGYLFHFINN